MEIHKLCKGGRRLSSYERNQKVIKKLCDLEKIAFVGYESVESGFLTLKKRAGADIQHPANWDSLSVNSLPVRHGAAIYTHEGHLRGQRGAQPPDVCYSTSQ